MLLQVWSLDHCGHQGLFQRFFEVDTVFIVIYIINDISCLYDLMLITSPRSIVIVPLLLIIFLVPFQPG